MSHISVKTEHVLMFFIITALLVVTYQIGTVTGMAPAERVELQDVETIALKVVPEAGFTTDVKWGNAVKNMVDTGVLDPEKLELVLTERYGQEIKPEWRRVLEGSDETLEINSDNSVFMMYVLWAFAKHNNVSLIHESVFAENFQGYDIGMGKAGYGDTVILELTAEQEELAKQIAQNSYRPCCGQSAANPDCSHGFAALGLIELMASQDFTEEEIYDAFIKFNSFWFPSTYIQNGLYFKIAEGKDWQDVDKKIVAGGQFSSVGGAQSVRSYLQELGY
jgi:hypothetical protein